MEMWVTERLKHVVVVLCWGFNYMCYINMLYYTLGFICYINMLYYTLGFICHINMLYYTDVYYIILYVIN